MLSGRSGETDRIVGLDLGADDYLVKPFSRGELAARVRSVLRRAGSPRPAPAGPDGIVVDVATRTVTVAGRSIELTARESDLLASSSAGPGRCSAVPSCSRWCGTARRDGRARRPSPSTCTACASRSIRPIRTVLGVGYQLEPGQTSHRKCGSRAIMNFMVGHLHTVVLDCRDPEALATFYAELLNLPVTVRRDDWVVIGGGESPRIAFQLAPDHRPPSWGDPQRPQQFHLDVQVDDIEGAEKRVLELGATRLPDEALGDDPDDRYRVYADPAGHPFCLEFD